MDKTDMNKDINTNWPLDAFYGDQWKLKSDIRKKLHDETGTYITLSPKSNVNDLDYEKIKSDVLKMKERLKEYSDSGYNEEVGKRLGLRCLNTFNGDSIEDFLNPDK